MSYTAWKNEVVGIYTEAYEVREKFVPSCDWEQYYSLGLTPEQAINSYLTSRYAHI